MDCWEVIGQIRVLTTLAGLDLVITLDAESSGQSDPRTPLQAPETLPLNLHPACSPMLMLQALSRLGIGTCALSNVAGGSVVD